tara:strand:+ start:127 stop:282 length:156 start_codon:yes stop_codon:yes gene_type:complete
MYYNVSFMFFRKGILYREDHQKGFDQCTKGRKMKIRRSESLIELISVAGKS